ncbi:MAG: hypothetical protein D6683_00525, partial [Actinomyces sp.]
MAFVAAGALASWVVDDVVLAADVPRGTVVGAVGLDPVRLGGLDEPDAGGRLAEAASALADVPVTLESADGTTLTLPAGELGVGLDVDATVDAARERGSWPLRPLRWLTGLVGEHRVEAVITVDRARLAAALEAAGEAPTAPLVELVDGSFRAATPDPRPRPDVDALADLLVAALVEPVPGAAGPTLVVPYGEPEPVDVSAAEAFAAELNELTAGGVRLRAGDAVATVDEGALRSWIRPRADAVPTGGAGGVGELFTLDTAAVDPVLADLFGDVAIPGDEARFEVVDPEPPVTAEDGRVTGGEVRIVGGEPDRSCCAADAADAVWAGLVAGDDPVEVPLAETPHPRGREWAESLGIRELVGGFTTHFKPGQSRVKNIERISELTRGVVIEPGETFSVNEFVGRRTTAKGFVAAGVIYNGVFRSDVGGGISQYATTLFNAAFFAGLDFGEYQSHSIYISRYPYGREATLSYPHPDLQIVNTTPYGVLVWPTTSEDSITVRLFSTPWVVAEQTDQTESRQGAACTRVTTERTRTWLADGHSEVDTVFAVYRPEGVAC